MLLYGKGSIKKNGIYDKVKLTLKSFNHIEFGGIEPNPVYETLMKAVELARKEKVDFLLPVGGGSVIDGAKFIAAAIPFEGSDPWTIVSEKAPVKSAVPFGTILTLPATGSEMNSGAVITRNSTKGKICFWICSHISKVFDSRYFGVKFVAKKSDRKWHCRCIHTYYRAIYDIPNKCTVAGQND